MKNISMKKNCLKKIDVELFKFFLSTIASFIFLTACPKNTNSNGQGAPQVVQNNTQPSCINCAPPISDQDFLITESIEMNNLFLIRLHFSGGINSANGASYAAGYNPSQYQGAISVHRGELVVFQEIRLTYCTIPAGTYSVGNLQSGYYQDGIIQNVKLIAAGPSQVMLSLNLGLISSPANRDVSGLLLMNQRLFGKNLVIETVNGQLCQSTVLVR